MVQGIILKAGLIAVAVLSGLGFAIWKLSMGRNKTTKQEKKAGTVDVRSHSEEEEKRKKLIARLKSLKIQADKAEAGIIYSKLFARIGRPIQKLLALEEEPIGTDNYTERLENDILSPTRNAMKEFQVFFTEEGISLPSKQTELEYEFSTRLEKLTERDLEVAIKEYQDRIRRAERYKIPQIAVNKMTSCLYKLITTPATELDLQEVRNLAEETRKALIQSGIYPMYRQDEKLAGRPDLRGFFIEVQTGGRRLPGLFIENKHQLQLYGNFQGTCYRGEE